MPVSSSRTRPIGSIHLLKNGGPTVRRSPRIASLSVGIHRREQDEERREQQDPVVREERGLTRHPRVELVARPQQRQPVDHQPEAEDQQHDHEDREHHGQLGILAEGVDRLHDAGPRHEGAEDRQEERQDHERDVPDAQHAAPLLHHHRVQERGRREPRQQAGVLDGVPAPVAAPAQLLVRPQHAERQAEASGTSSRSSSSGGRRAATRRRDAR